MPKKSAADLTIIPATPRDNRLPTPTDLSETERALWASIVNAKPADWFDADSAPVLKEYVRAASACDLLAGVVARALASGDVKAMRQALNVRDQESRRCAILATKLRLTIQSRYSPKSAATATRKAGAPRPWQS
jgi:hypothetical protein